MWNDERKSSSDNESENESGSESGSGSGSGSGSESDNDIKKNSIIKNINKIIKYHNINISIWDYIVSFFE